STITQRVSINVNPAPLTIATDNQAMVYGAPMPALTASYTGLVNGDKPADFRFPPLLTTAPPTSHVGTYVIAAVGAVNPDYAVTYTAGPLSISPASLNIAANNVAVMYGDALPLLTATYTGLVNGDAASAVQGLLLSTVQAGSPVGAYPITASGASNPDYH